MLEEGRRAVRRDGRLFDQGINVDLVLVRKDFVPLLILFQVEGPRRLFAVGTRLHFGNSNFGMEGLGNAGTDGSEGKRSPRFVCEFRDLLTRRVFCPESERAKGLKLGNLGPSAAHGIESPISRHNRVTDAILTTVNSSSRDVPGAQPGKLRSHELGRALSQNLNPAPRPFQPLTTTKAGMHPETGTPASNECSC